MAARSSAACGRDLMLVAVMRSARQQRAGAIVVEGEDMAGTGLERDLADPAEVAAGADHHRRLGIADEIFDFRALVGGVQRQEDIAGAQGRQVQQHRLDRFFHLHGDARTRGQVERAQQVGDHGRGPIQVAPGIDQPAVGLHRGAVQVFGKRRAQRGKHVVIAHGVAGVGMGARTRRKGLRWRRRPGPCRARAPRGCGRGA